MKLGLVIRIASGGEGEHSSINKDLSWGNFIEDVRSTTDELTDFYRTGKTVKFLKFLGEYGYLICVVQAAPDGSERLRDSTAAWIHIPANMDIHGEKLVSVIQEVEFAISARKGIDVERLKNVFEKDYNCKEVLISAASTIRSNNEAGFAARTCGHGADYQLHELLGEYLYQTEYNNYKSVFLLEKSSGVSMKNGNLLKFKLKPMCTFPAPNNTMGFCAYIDKPLTLFNKPIEVIDGTKVTLRWKKEGCSDICKSFTAIFLNSNTTPKEVYISTSDCKRIIERSWFRVFSKNHVKLENLVIRINDTIFKDNTLEISEESFNRGVRLNISCEGYKDIMKNNVQFPIPEFLYMEDKIYYYEFFLPTYNCGQIKEKGAKVIIETNHLLTGSPIKGYLSLNRIYEGVDNGKYNYLKYSDNLKLKVKYFLCGLLSFFFIGLLLTGWKELNSFKESPEFSIDKLPIKENNSIDADNTDDANNEINTNDSIQMTATNYLDSNETWIKDSLNCYSQLKGLFEDLNVFRKDKIENEWSHKLNDSKNFMKIVDALKKCKWDPAIGKEENDGKYNSVSENEITIAQYINWISIEHKSDLTKSTKVSILESKSSKANNNIAAGKKNEPTNFTKPQVENNSNKKKNIRGGLY